MNIVSAKSCSIEVRKQSLTHLLAQSHNTPTIMNEYIGYSPNNPSLQSYISWVRALYSYSKIYKSEHRIYRIQHLDWPFSECECKNLTKHFITDCYFVSVLSFIICIYVFISRHAQCLLEGYRYIHEQILYPNIQITFCWWLSIEKNHYVNTKS